MRSLVVAVAVALTAFPVSSQAGFLSDVGTYFKDRGHDLLDVLRLRAGVPEDGKGLGVKAKATSLAQVGYVHFNGRMIGMERRALGITYERRTEGGLSLLYGSLNEMEPLRGNSFLKANSDWSMIEDRRIIRNLPHWDDGRRRFLGVGAEVATPLFALDVGVYPEEAIDFVLGWVGIDIFDDDELWLVDRVSIPAMEPRLSPNPLAPFAGKRLALRDFDDSVTLQQAMEDIAPIDSVTAPEPTMGTEAGEVIPEERPMERGIDGMRTRRDRNGERIREKDADEAIRQIEAAPVIPVPVAPPPPEELEEEVVDVIDEIEEDDPE